MKTSIPWLCILSPVPPPPPPRRSPQMSLHIFCWNTKEHYLHWHHTWQATRQDSRYHTASNLTGLCYTPWTCITLFSLSTGQWKSLYFYFTCNNSQISTKAILIMLIAMQRSLFSRPCMQSLKGTARRFIVHRKMSYECSTCKQSPVLHIILLQGDASHTSHLPSVLEWVSCSIHENS